GGLALTLAAPLVAPVAAQDSADAAPVSPDSALRRLIDGNARYVDNAAINTDHSTTRAARAEGQQPFAAIVSCSDSRVAPELIFDQGPGELFVVRVAGNFISEEGLATLEYGVAVLGIKTILVLGHTACGAVDATIASINDRELPPGHLPSLVNAIRPAVYEVMDSAPDDLLAAATAQNARRNAERAKTESAILSDAYAAGKLDTVAGIYEIATGKVTLL
ncbi:MAG TPA: carbonic anhydrase, partial [Methylomirabilota bacterium]|nr:carbonic anhydrase [Methylomirabilota bacterium]